MSEDAPTHSSWFISSKFSPPHSHSGTISRYLVQRLLNPDSAIVLLKAPAGFGKTTLAAQAFDKIRSAGGQAAWLTLDKDDADPKTFLAYLVAALAHQGIALDGLETYAFSGFSRVSFKAGIAMTANCLNALSKSTTLFLDDVHLAGGEAMREVLSTLIDQAGSATRFVIATRHTPELGLSKLMLSGRLDTIEANDLRFNEDEGRMILRPYADPANIAAILDRTQGWPVVMQLLRISINNRKLLWHDVLNFSGRTAEFANYLSEQIAGGMGDESIATLMTLSIFERFNGDLLNHLDGKLDGWGFIENCVRQGLLMTPLDAEGRWYTLHRLFREFLIERWTRIDPQAIADTHRRAAHWFREEKLVQEAVRHADLGEDSDLVAEILTEAGGWLAALHGGPALMRIIAGLPQSSLASDPSLRLGHVYLLIQDGELPAARRMLDDLRQSVPAESFGIAHDRAFFELSVEAIDSLLLSYEGKILRPDALRALRESYAFDVPIELDALINNIIGYLHFSNGDIRSAIKFGRLVTDNKGRGNVEFVEAYTNIWLTEAYLQLGETGNADYRIGLAIALSDRNFGTESAPAIAGRVFQSELLFEQKDLARARSQLSAQLPKIGLNDQWFNVYATAYRVGSEIALIEHGPDAALAFLKDAAANLSADELEKMASYLDILRTDLLLTAGHEDSARTAFDNSAAPHYDEGQSITSSAYLARTIAGIRLDMAVGDHNAATTRLTDLADRLKEAGSRRWLVIVNSLLASCRFALGNREAAAALAEEVVALARTCGLKGSLHLVRMIQPAFWSDPQIAARVRLDSEPAAATNAPRPAVPATSPALPGLRFGPREQEVLTYLLDGMTSKEIARATGLAIGTVLSHRKSIYRKLGVNSRSAAIAAARNLTAPPAG